MSGIPTAWKHIYVLCV